MALCAGLVLLLIAIVLQPPTSREVRNTDEPIVTVAPERKAIAIADSNQDGVPDWQEGFSNTAPVTLSENDSAYETPDTLTDQFSQQFFEQMVRTTQYGDFSASQSELIAASSRTLVQQVEDEMIELSDIPRSTDTSAAALKQFSETMARIILSESDDTGGNEAEILLTALRSEDEADLAPLAAKAAVYDSYLQQSLQVPTPPQLLEEQLTLLNAFQALRNDIAAMEQAFTDPLTALLRLKRYQDDVDGLYAALAGMYEELVVAGVTWDNNSPVLQLISIE